MIAGSLLEPAVRVEGRMERLNDVLGLSEAKSRLTEKDRSVEKWIMGYLGRSGSVESVSNELWFMVDFDQWFGFQRKGCLCRG